MLTEICAYLRNYFLRDYYDPDRYIHHGTFTIADNHMQALSFLLPGQHYRVIGSVFNDGVWRYDPNNPPTMTDETFDGTIWAMSVPKDVLDLATEIAAWNEANASALSGPYQSESMTSSGYSYTKASGGTAGNETVPYNWRNQFAARLKPYKRQSVL